MGDDDFGTVLRNARVERGLSLSGLARLIHYSRGYLSKVETGKSPPNWAFADRCDRALDLGGRLSGMIAVPRRASAMGRSQVVRLERPFDLPMVPSHFGGRDAELADVLRLADPGRQPDKVPVVLLHGPGGVGKTALAVTAGHRLRAAFPDGCLFVDMHGYTPGRLPVSALDALGLLLRRLGLPAHAISEALEERAGQYRSLLQERRVLVVIDDARRAEQVRPLIPSGVGCAVVVASRRRLPALDDASPVRLEPLSVDGGVRLFRAVSGLADDDGADLRVAEVVRRCGFLPLTIRIAAARGQGGTAVDIADLLRRLTDHRHRLAELDDGERSATAVLTTSTAALPVESRRLLALLPLVPGGLTEVTASWPADQEPAMCGRQLRNLAEDNLLVHSGGGRYRMHDLVRVYAADVLLEAVPEPERTAALRRVVVGYLATAAAADRLLTPHRYQLPIELWPAPAPAVDVVDAQAAFDWLATEEEALVMVSRTALEHGWNSECWQLAYVLRGYFFLAKSWDIWVETHRVALVAAERDANPWAVAVTNNNFGLALIERGQVSAAKTHYLTALAIFRRLDDVAGEAATLGHLAWADYCAGDDVSVARLGRRAVQLYESQGEARGAGINLRTVAMAEMRQGHHDTAAEDLHRALDLFIDLHLPLDTAMALINLGALAALRGDLADAVRRFGRAVEVAGSCGSEYEQARALDGLATVAAAAGRHRAAARFADRARILFEALHVPSDERARVAPLSADPLPPSATAMN